MAPTEQQRKVARAKVISGQKTATKARVERYLKSVGPHIKETGKSTLLLAGIRVNQAMRQVLQELRALQAPACKLLTKTNTITPFDSNNNNTKAGAGGAGGGGGQQQSLEFLLIKNDCALFAVASHNKKRPNNLIMGRAFNQTVLDMAELGILRFKSALQDYGGTIPKKRIGSKPLLLFVGDVWQVSTNYQNLQNLLIDFYRGQVVDKLVATGVDHIIVFTAAAAAPVTPAAGVGKSSTDNIMIHQRTYHIQLKKNPDPKADSRIPFPFLAACGPDIDFVLRRTQWADDEMYKAARQQPMGPGKSSKDKSNNKTKKNLSTNLFGETVGRLHLEKQNLDKKQGRKVKALRRAEKATHEEEDAALEQELAQEDAGIRKEFKETFGFEEANAADTKDSKKDKRSKK